jgi:hypothetical protein
MPREFGKEIGTLESRRGPKLAYDLEFRKLLRENPGIINAAIELANVGVLEYNPPAVMYGKTELRYDKKSQKWLYEARRSVFKDGKIALDEKGEPIYESGNWRPMDFGRLVILAPGNTLKDSNLELTVLGRSNREIAAMNGTRIDVCDYFKLSLQGHTFFAKRSFQTKNPGFQEFENTLKATEALAGLDFVKVIEAQLGYQDQHESWYISKWEDLEGAGFAPYQKGMGMTEVDDYGKIHGLKIGEKGAFVGFPSREDYDEAEAKYKIIEQILMTHTTHYFYDLGANIFYNLKTKTFVVLDVTGGKKDPKKNK